MDQIATEPSANGWEALGVGRWDQAKAAFEAELRTGETPASLVGLHRRLGTREDRVGAALSHDEYASRPR